ncbi:Pimeloyl-ACP methyl ester carboxylesterase [Rhizobium sp. NFR07]|uniref:alpha/beta fold hydrolase n=1 Tax=Rhizobium sp. NFR07 TaxID=1566262 RepID=UPI0008ECDCC9|nr:alpha/beta hydrolase [Rhizobium sp. NFR07]SFB46339.1 Pimeloyl-ACP methyl ester carboxylesterase [Rhizobium sp. NFR07]
MRQTLNRKIETSQGLVSVSESSGDGADVLFIHGNSSDSRVFQKQFDDLSARSHRFIALDLPGHGASDDATNPWTGYTKRGLALACLEVLEALRVDRPLVVGWSLGGHVAIEMLAHSKAFSGVMIVGTPAIGDDMREGFRGNPSGSLASQASLTHEQAARFVTGIFGENAEAFMVEAVQRTDKRFRPTLFDPASRSGDANQRDTVMVSQVPIAVVNGADDPIVNLDYEESVPYGNLWSGRCYRIAKATHAPFWQTPGEFNLLLSRFVDDLAA